jgi:patatin-like phospholipase/acyl hydrolase
MKKILSIDGGGIRGIIPAFILREIERETGKKSWQIFDLCGGTSTGGLITLMLGLGMSATEVMDIYTHDGPRIFKKRVLAIGGIAGPRFDSSSLQLLATEILKDSTLLSMKTKVMITSFCLEMDRVNTYKSYEPSDCGILCVDVAMSTTAAPTYFKPHKKHYGNIDAGIFLNNPALYAMAESRLIWPKEETRVLSLGTGVLSPARLTKDYDVAGFMKWGKNLVDIGCAGQSDSADYMCMAFSNEGKYLRIQDELIPEINPDLAACDPQNIEYLSIFAERLWNDNQAKILEFIS